MCDYYTNARKTAMLFLGGNCLRAGEGSPVPFWCRMSTCAFCCGKRHSRLCRVPSGCSRKGDVRLLYHSPVFLESGFLPCVSRKRDKEAGPAAIWPAPGDALRPRPPQARRRRARRAAGPGRAKKTGRSVLSFTGASPPRRGANLGAGHRRESRVPGPASPSGGLRQTIMCAAAGKHPSLTSRRTAGQNKCIRGFR